MLLLLGSPAVVADCTRQGADMTCAGVPVEGIREDNSAIRQIVVEPGGDGSTPVEPGQTGIFLRQTGLHGTDQVRETEFGNNTVQLDHDGDGAEQEPTPEWTVLADDQGQPVLIDGYYVRLLPNDAFSLANDSGTLRSFGDGDALAEYLLEEEVALGDGGGALTGSLTVDNRASFETVDADGITTVSSGGKGGNGGCTSYLVYTKCRGGWAGGNAGSVAVNHRGAITVRGDGVHGIRAVSLGGQGGNGGGSFGAFYSSAGRGGNGGHGAQVSVLLSSSSVIETFGAGSYGVLASSSGGNGGRGGSSSGSVALGSAGGNGGNAGLVNVIHHGQITTHGEASYGIYALSTGAGAGKGSSSGGLVAVGGNGGGESSGNQVTVINTGTILTGGENAIGIFAQSIGGGGGDGGGAGGLFSVGGSGGSGGGSDLVTVNNAGVIRTQGEGATAILAQSIGGGGGNGGNAVSGGTSGSVAVGGDGGLGGDGNDVLINALASGEGLADLIAGVIETSGARAHGIQAQSIGGGGGNGGLAVAGSVDPGFSASVALGGSGGQGGDAAAVTINQHGEVLTGGDHAHGIFAQSVGGGGGSGGGAISASVSGGYAMGLALGGSGGQGGDAGEVAVSLLGDVSTQGTQSFGVLAQSVGGGGGDGGFAAVVTTGSVSGSVSLGGGGGQAGHASDVSVRIGEVANAHQIATQGEGAHGVFAQSVGGGGGNGGMAISGSLGGGSVSVALGGSGSGGGNAGAVGLVNYNLIQALGESATGLMAQSVGGGGGHGGFALSGAVGVLSAAAAVGGSGGGGGDGGDVSLENHGTVITEGNLGYGVLAQSVGGGGGNGGSAVSATLAISVENVPAAGASVAIGGRGGTASHGGEVLLANTGSVQTGTQTTVDDEVVRTGQGAHALFAQSVGGGGGNGGFAGAAALTLGQGASFAVAVGGQGGAGGDGGEVALTSTGEVLQTFGDGADGIHAQSIGGGGGDAGFGLALAASGGGQTNLSVGVAIGGAGGDGGTGNLVSVDNQSAINTAGNQSNGILAQSIGGGGGNGGFAATGTVTVSGNAAQAGVSVGGQGGTGNFASAVTVSNAGAITTLGDGSLGILAQSIGGGGGNGGLSVTGQFVMSEDYSGQVGLAIGGNGGQGSYGGQVAVDNLAAGSITTYGLGAHGIQAQSVGGGGGKGGLAVYGGISKAGNEKSLSIAGSVGGWGGDGGYGDRVDVVNAGAIRVHDDSAIGILAQSIGGGGGDGGDAYTGLLGLSNTSQSQATTYNLAASVGGEGGSGNHAGAVKVVNSGSIITGSLTEIDGVEYVAGMGGYGIYAQSVGGGGGIGGRANTMNVVFGGVCTVPLACDRSNNNLALAVTVGGFGGAGGDGDAVEVINTGTLVTLGDTADAIFAQSVGGGGGSGGNGVNGVEGGPPLKSYTPIYQDISVVVGGNGGASGNGGDVLAQNAAEILTSGANSNGIFAQSVGGGGGVGGKAVIGAVGKVGVGGEGGAGGDGGRVDVAQLGGGTIETLAVASHGIFAQSVGGGGGMAGNVDRMFASGVLSHLGDVGDGMGSGIEAAFGVGIGLGLAFGRDAGNGGHGGAVDVSVDGNILTHGDSSAGVFAQSVGGGGGVRGELGNEGPVLSMLSWHIGSNGDAGNGGGVNVEVDGNVLASGNAAQGIFAQSSGGKGVAGDVDVLVRGQVLMAALLEDEDGTADDPQRGLGAVGIMAHSAALGSDGDLGQDDSVDRANSGDITITIAGADSVVRGGRSQVVRDDPADYAEYVGIGVWLLDGRNNTVTNEGTILTADGVQGGLAIYASGSHGEIGLSGGHTTVDNHGLIIGSVDLGEGTNAFNNFSSAQFDTGRAVDLGAGNTLSNEGRVEIGGAGAILTTELTGRFAQSGDGTLGLDLDLARSGGADEADRLNATGDIVLAGDVDLHVHNVSQLKPGQYSVTLAESQTSLANAGLTLLHPESAVIQFDYRLVGDTALQLDYGIDFQVDGLTGNQQALGGHINAIQTAGGSDTLAPFVTSLFYLPDAESYQQAVRQMLPSAYQANEATTLFAGMNFARKMLSCRSSDGAYRYVAEQECAWMSLQRETSRRDETDDLPESRQDTTAFAYGIQAALDRQERFFAGFGVGFDKVQGNAGDSMKSDGTRFHLGAVLKARWGNSVLSSSFSGALANMDVVRTVSMPGQPVQHLEATQRLRYLAVNGMASHAFEFGNLYLKPMLGLGMTHMMYSGYTEQGGPLALRVSGDRHTYVSLSPALELGGELGLGRSALLRPYAQVGATRLLSGDDPSISVALAAAPGGVGAFTVSDQLDDTLLDITAGVDLLTHDGFSVRLSGTARTGDTVRDYGGQLKIGLRY
ncbi:Outer membrane autotransporter barrel [Isoalcanivorax pacificus W11-5]|uniref:Outer membrane autotransporter barrel n=1 Tax=Isoalcanivorax pacificus W11-5 TaxID=391936 RepID=A0A0B4XSV0_9GAMM|nr:autotransporter outer membrane beta-barrel domain-containing protein [Isoalcanivorax pacificus]AJD49503.1 Outer membrane autotransporter barrel [Isoalcanivorax pacificus W11-5]